MTTLKIEKQYDALNVFAGKFLTGMRIIDEADFSDFTVGLFNVVKGGFWIFGGKVVATMYPSQRTIRVYDLREKDTMLRLAEAYEAYRPKAKIRVIIEEQMEA